MPDPTLPTARRRRDRCPGVTRPWLADDGALVRLRLVGGALPAPALLRLSEVAQRWGDGDVHLTARANLQLRALPHDGDRLTPPVAEALAATGLVPAPRHDLVRNVMVSPQSGLAGGRADLRPVAALLDSLLRADDDLTALPGRFLLTLDDGRGDLHEAPTDLGLVALDATRAQLRVGARGWGAVVDLPRAPQAVLDLARDFLRLRGGGPDAPWHVDELAGLGVPLAHPLARPTDPDPAALVTADPLPAGRVPGGTHVLAPEGRLDPALARALCRTGTDLVVTPWRGVLVPDLAPAPAPAQETTR